MGRKLSRFACCLLLGVAVLCGTVRSGAHYFYCDALGLLTSDPCATGDRDAASCPFESVAPQPVDCCLRITMPAMPDGAQANGVAVAPAGVVSILPAVDYTVCSLRENALARMHRGERLRGPPGATADLHTRLMVFLT